MNAIAALLTGLFDYAGLYPPAGLSMRSAANNYLEYSRGARAWALGRFIVNLERIDELRSVVGDSLGRFRLSVIATENTDWATLVAPTGSLALVDSVEIRCGTSADVERLAAQIPRQLAVYFEVANDASGQAALREIAALGARAKIRMGGVVADAFPSIRDVAGMLKTLADLRLPFKATAGLHHPLRSRRPLTYQQESPEGVMHGFMNFICASACLYLGGDAKDVEGILEERDPSAWRVSPNAIEWRHHRWKTAQLREIRSRFLFSIGSCSFEEPIRDLESLGWL